MMVFFPGGSFIVGFWLMILVMAVSIAIAVLLAALGFWFKTEVLWNTKRAEAIKTGVPGPWPWYLRGNTLPIICGMVGFFSTLYALMGPYCYFMTWLRS